MNGNSLTSCRSQLSTLLNIQNYDNKRASLQRKKDVSLGSEKLLKYGKESRHRTPWISAHG